MTTAVPPKGMGPLAKREARLAWGLLFPTIFSVSIVVILPLLAIFWVSFKPIGLEDLRPPETVVREQLRGRPAAAGDSATLRYRVRNSSQKEALFGVTITDTLPDGLKIVSVDERCTLSGLALACDLGDFESGQRENIEIDVEVSQAFLDADPDLEDTPTIATGRGKNILTNAEFTLENFARIFDGREFWAVLYATMFYTIVGTIGALVVGLFAALLLNKEFRGKGFVRGLYLFPYVAPVIAVAFSWVTLFDPFSGSVNALLVQMGVIDSSINFFGQRPSGTHHGHRLRDLALLPSLVPLHSCANAVDRQRYVRGSGHGRRKPVPEVLVSFHSNAPRHSEAYSSCFASSGPSTSSTTSSC